MIRSSLHVITASATAMAIGLMAQAIGRGHADTDALVVTGITLVESRTVDPNLVDETYRASMTNHGRPGRADVARVTARLVHPFFHSHPGSPQIVDGDVTFGAIRGGTTVDSLDTFTVRRHRNAPLTLHQLRWSIAARPDLILSDAWAGRWRLDVTSADAATGDVTSMATVTDSIGRDEPFGFSVLPELVHCTWSDAGDSITGDCSARARFDDCRLVGSGRFTVDRAGASLEGHGEWQLTMSGNCGLHAESAAERVQISGVRLSESVDPEPASPGLLVKIATVPGLAALIGEGLHDLPERPESDEECRRGGWRRFVNPTFRNAHECATFAERHDDERHESRR